MKTKTFTKIHYSKDAAMNHKENIEKAGGKVTMRKLYSEAAGKNYYELSYTFKR